MIGIDRANFKAVANALAFGITLIAIGTGLKLPQAFGWAIYPQQIIAVILSLALPLAYLTCPFRPDQSDLPMPVYDIVFAGLSFVALGYVAIQYQYIVNMVFLSPIAAYLPGVVIVVLLMEAVRRVTGWPLAAFVGLCLIYAGIGYLLPGRLQAPDVSWRIIAGYMAFDSNAILGIPLLIAATIVTTFIFFGHLLSRSGGSDFFMDSASYLVGRSRGGAMKASIVASGLFGSISGSAVANVMATGVVTIPMMKKAKCSAQTAAAVEAAASTGGQLMPPVMGAAAFLMAEYLQLPYADIAMAALVPALLYYAAVFIQIDLEGAKTGQGEMPSADQRSMRVIVGGLHYILSFAILLFCLFSIRWAPERAALAGALTIASTALLFGYNSARPSLSHLLMSLVSAGHAAMEIVLISASAGLVIGVLNLTGLGFTLSVWLLEIGGTSIALLLVLSAVICILLGMGLPTLGVYVLLATLVAPALVQVGIDPMAAHLFVIYFGMMSMITPPIALAVFAAKSIANAPTFRTCLAAMKLGWVAYLVPFLFILTPELILDGEFVGIVIAIGTAIAGVWLVSIGLSGYLFFNTTMVGQISFCVVGALSLFPQNLLSSAMYLKVIGIVGGIFLLVMHWRQFKRQKITQQFE